MTAPSFVDVSRRPTVHLLQSSIVQASCVAARVAGTPQKGIRPFPKRQDRHETGSGKRAGGSADGRFRPARVQRWIDFQSTASRAVASNTGPCKVSRGDQSVVSAANDNDPRLI